MYVNVKLRLKETHKLILSRLLCFQMDLMPFVNKAGCECLNESDDYGFDNCLIKDPSYLESDCDEQVGAVNSLDPRNHKNEGEFSQFMPYLHICNFSLAQYLYLKVSRLEERLQFFSTSSTKQSSP